ncbi:hypothetical protein [Streptomyces sp. NPDC058412]|uniref:hypothetical protein n=1 Tax=Streptomyces sp. NPDC058412 TaxID=3346486 RepID=UPI0036575066
MSHPAPFPSRGPRPWGTAGACVLHRRRRAAACKTTAGPVDLGLQTVDATPDDRVR